MLSIYRITVGGFDIAIAAGWIKSQQAQQTKFKQALETRKYQIFYQQALVHAREKVGKVKNITNLIYSKKKLLKLNDKTFHQMHLFLPKSLNS